MPSPEEIAARKQARQIAAELADLVLGETKAMSAETKAAFYGSASCPRPAPERR